MLSSTTIEVNKLLGTGASAKVYRGKWGKSDQPVAIKIFRTSIERIDDDRALKKFTVEMKILRKLTNAGAIGSIAYIDAAIINDMSRGFILIVMQLAVNGSLRDLFKYPTKLNFDFQMKTALGIVQGVKFIHDNGILHLDIKPGNIVFDENFDVKIIDFELARDLKGKESYTPHNQGVSGTWDYIASEIKEYQQPTYSKSSDIYSMAVTIWELLAKISVADYIDIVTNTKKTANEIPRHLTSWSKKSHVIKYQTKLPLPSTPPSLAKLITWGWKDDPIERPTDEQAEYTIKQAMNEYKSNIDYTRK